MMEIKELYTIVNAKRMSAGMYRLTPYQFLSQLLTEMWPRGIVTINETGDVQLPGNTGVNK